ncbi:hypothetical protein LOZ53_001617 [Ophidiomyces ophidiicola]|nr:hypothetical protein LOZ61_002153 [Ophidiomyces ophidiicola]KAI1924450.1 hypothetical protein LOZ60_004737 [Ophidiomyces ophidiicola]KAI1980998.1 hypothetical protein LOZ55_000884 [Ophidiomyces ophidiicola]KAI1990536.1 hypothetical protein LOZ51_004887 [Ophidiomyces ophidiicola]KAI1994352.1 hypothetical protein LOZ54_001022 [Ophidiomyces ophidiicola]
MASNILNSPFSTAIPPGHGKVVLSVLPPGIPSLSTLSYKYPLKLISRVSTCNSETSTVSPLHLYVLSYGGGLLPGDHINVCIELKPHSKLVVTTPQGSTKIFKTGPRLSQKGSPPGVADNLKSDRSQQIVNVDLCPESSLCYLPDPAVPFKNSKYEQIQLFTFLEGEYCGSQEPIENELPNRKSRRPSLCILDWVTEGRSARGEKWSFDLWHSRNEVWVKDCKTGRKRLLLRDNLTLSNEAGPSDPGAESRAHPLAMPPSIIARTAPHTVLGTLILYGPLFDSLSAFFMNAFSSEPRIGARNWSSNKSSVEQSAQKPPIITWTAAQVRSGFVLVKFGAPDFESAKRWLGGMLREEGSIMKEFGDEALSYL